jgi:hypothetical protein
VPLENACTDIHRDVCSRRVGGAGQGSISQSCQRASAQGDRQGGNDSEALANYNDQGGSAYAQATDGYTALYGDKQVYQERFRLGYIAGYKAGWDFNAGRYSPLGAGSW